MTKRQYNRIVDKINKLKKYRQFAMANKDFDSVEKIDNKLEDLIDLLDNANIAFSTADCHKIT